MTRDISPNVVAVLLVLVIVVSLIGTWFFLTAYEPTSQTQVSSSPSAGQVSLDIAQKTQPVPSQANVQLQIAEAS